VFEARRPKRLVMGVAADVVVGFTGDIDLDGPLDSLDVRVDLEDRVNEYVGWERFVVRVVTGGTTADPDAIEEGMLSVATSSGLVFLLV
jgi:hypothetical protein